MSLDTEARKQVDYFIGTEVEHTAMKGEKTLFVVGIKPLDEIVATARRYKINHIYFGTSQSFTPNSVDEWQQWDHMIRPLLSLGYWVTLDFDIKHIEFIHESCWNEYNTFIPMISAKIPAIKLLNYNAVLKIDDVTWGKTNPGVWCHSVHELMNKSAFTGWKDYVGDKTVKPVKVPKNKS